MGFFFHYTCDRCGRRLATDDREDSLYYVLPDGREFPMTTADAWCDRCRGFVLAESHWAFHCSAEHLEKFRRDFENGRLHTLFADIEDLATEPEKLAQFSNGTAAMLEWRRLRQSPPKCICCGSAAIIYLDDGAQTTFLHPRCGGKFAILGDPWHSTLAEFRDYKYGVEGPTPATDRLRNRWFFARCRFRDWIRRILFTKRAPMSMERRVGDFLATERAFPIANRHP